MRKQTVRWVLAGCLVAGVVWVIAIGLTKEPINMTPLARVVVMGAPSLLNPKAPVPRRFLDVLADGFVDDQYVAELPQQGARSVVELQFPWPVVVERIAVIGWSGGGGGEVGEVQVAAFEGAREVWRSEPTTWAPPAEGLPPLAEFHPAGAATSYRFQFRAFGPPVVNSIQCYATASRWCGWSWLVGLQMLAPWLGGLVWAVAVVGWGRAGSWMAGRKTPDGGAVEWGRAIIVGLTIMAGASAIWFFLPAALREGNWGVVAYAVLLAPAVLVLCGKMTREEVRFGAALAAAALLMLTTAAVESTFVTDGRVKPMDHLFGLMTAEHLSAGLKVPDEMVLRPWLVAALAAPTAGVYGRFSYWMYLGQIAWINALGLALVASCGRRWGLPAVGVVAFLGLLPLTTVYHYSGQRVLVAGLTLFALMEWTARERLRWWLWGGWGAGLGVLAHPGALFVLPPAAIYFFWSASARGRRLFGIASVGLALAAYGGWVLFSAKYAPEVRNNLAYYPIMATLDEPPPPGKNLLEAARGLSAEEWRTLAWNRVKQLRHYVWAENPWQRAVHERLHPVSLNSTLGVVLTLMLVRRLSWLRRESVFWVGVAGPLLFFHLHIGQAFPQFHILPTPFFALALLGLAVVWRASAWIVYVVLGEALVHHLFVPALVLSGLAGNQLLPNWCVGDPLAKGLILLPMAPAVWLAVMLMRQRRGLGGVS